MGCVNESLETVRPVRKNGSPISNSFNLDTVFYLYDDLTLTLDFWESWLHWKSWDDQVLYDNRLMTRWEAKMSIENSVEERKRHIRQDLKIKTQEQYKYVDRKRATYKGITYDQLGYILNELTPEVHDELKHLDNQIKQNRAYFQYVNRKTSSVDSKPSSNREQEEKDMHHRNGEIWYQQKQAEERDRRFQEEMRRRNRR